MSIAQFPHRYTVTLADDTIAAAPRTSIAIGPPPEFGGTDGAWSPEHLLVAAAAASLKTTFDAVAKRQHLTVRDWRAEATATLARRATGPEITGIEISVSFTCDEPARGRTALAAAERACIVSRALVAPVHVHATFVEAARPTPTAADHATVS